MIALIDAPDWAPRAACLGGDPDAWYPEKGEPATEARAVCWERCPVRESCLEWALANDERHGVWGGYSARERRQMRLQRKAVA